MLSDSTRVNKIGGKLIEHFDCSSPEEAINDNEFLMKYLIIFNLK